MSGWQVRLVDERMGLQVRVEALRWRVEVLPGCPPDVRQALAEGEPLEGEARNERDAMQRGLVAYGRVQGWVLARRQPRQEHLFAAERFDRARELDWLNLRIGLEAAVLAMDFGWVWVAGAILMWTRDRSANTYGLAASDHATARKLVDQVAAGMRGRRLPL